MSSSPGHFLAGQVSFLAYLPNRQGSRQAILSNKMSEPCVDLNTVSSNQGYLPQRFQIAGYMQLSGSYHSTLWKSLPPRPQPLVTAPLTQIKHTCICPLSQCDYSNQANMKLSNPNIYQIKGSEVFFSQWTKNI